MATEGDYEKSIISIGLLKEWTALTKEPPNVKYSLK